MTQNQHTELRVTPQLELPLSAALLASVINNGTSSSQQSSLQNNETSVLDSDDDEFSERNKKINCATPLDKVQSEFIAPAQVCLQNEIIDTTGCSNKTQILSQQAVLQNIIFIESNKTTLTMGNRQSETKESGNETPDEQTPTCCSTPKRKPKNKSEKQLSTVRREDPDFDTKEVYPFDTKCKEDSEIVEPVDLDPFEIVETDDLSFIAGAGTSGVILSGTNGQYRISREIILEEKEISEVSSTEHETGEGCCRKTNESDTEIKPHLVKQTESGLINETEDKGATLHVTHESRNNDEQENIKVEKQSDLSLSSVDNSTDRHSKVILLSQNMFSNLKDEKDTCTVKAEAGDDIKAKSADLKHTTTKKEKIFDTTLDSEMQTDTHARVSPNVNETLDQPKYKTEDKDNVVYENLNATDVEKIIAKQAPLETVVPVKYILTQEMFKTKELISNENEQQRDIGNAPLASMEDTDLSESNSDISGVLKHTLKEKIPVQTHEHNLTRNNDVVNISNPTYGYSNDDDSIISGTKEENVYETVDVRTNRLSDKQGQNRQYENISVAKKVTDVQTDTPETSIISPLPKSVETKLNHQGETNELVVDGHSSETAIEHPKDTKDSNPNEKLSITEKQSHNASVTQTLNSDHIRIERISVENKGQQNALGLLKSAILSKTDSLEVPSRDGSVAISREDTVPPPSPAPMNILTEENEDEDDDTEHTKSNEIVDFGDVVCKRLSKLLEDKSFQDEDTATTNVDQDSIIYFSPREFVDTSTGRYEMEDIEAYNETKEAETEMKKNNVSDSAHIQDTLIQQRSPEGLSLSFESNHSQDIEVEHLAIKRNDSAETLKRASGDSTKYVSQYSGSSSDDLPDFFDPDNIHSKSKKSAPLQKEDSKLSLPLQDFDDTIVETTPNSSFVDDLTDVTPTAGFSGEFTALPELAKTVDKSVIQHEHTDQTPGRRSITGTDSDLDLSEQRTNISTDSMYADDEAEETMDILFTKTYTEPMEGAEVFLSCTVVNSAFKDEAKKRDAWLSSDEALEYFEANASEVMSTAFMKAKKEMKDIQVCLQNLRKQMDNFHGNYEDISLPDLPKAVANSLSPDSIGVQRKAVTD